MPDLQQVADHECLGNRVYIISTDDTVAATARDIFVEKGMSVVNSDLAHCDEQPLRRQILEMMGAGSVAVPFDYWSTVAGTVLSQLASVLQMRFFSVEGTELKTGSLVAKR